MSNHVPIFSLEQFIDIFGNPIPLGGHFPFSAPCRAVSAHHAVAQEPGFEIWMHPNVWKGTFPFLSAHVCTVGDNFMGGSKAHSLTQVVVVSYDLSRFVDDFCYSLLSIGLYRLKKRARDDVRHPCAKARLRIDRPKF